MLPAAGCAVCQCSPTAAHDVFLPVSRLVERVMPSPLTGPRFFAGEVSAGKPLKVNLEGKELNITHCALATKSKSNDAYKLTKLYVATKTLSDENAGDKGSQKFVLCSLRDGQSCKIDATFFPGDQVVKFLASGPNTLHLTGWYLRKIVETYEEEEDDQSIDETIVKN